MRTVLKCLAVCVLVFAFIVYAGYLRTGHFWFPAVKAPVLSGLWKQPEMNSLEAPTSPTWRWRQNGVWHYGDSPPEGVDAQRLDSAASNETNSPDN